MPFDGLWSRGENHRREVRRMMDSRLGQFTADESCNKLHEKIFLQLAKLLKKQTTPNQFDRFLECLNDKSGSRDCFKVPRDTFKKFKLGDDRSAVQLRSAPAYFFAKIFAHSSLRDPADMQPKTSCCNHYDPAGPMVCIHPYHSTVKVESFLITPGLERLVAGEPGDFDIGISTNDIAEVLSEQSSTTGGPESPPGNHSGDSFQVPLSPNQLLVTPHSPPGVPVNYNMGPSWISISYNEYEKSFGNRFTVHNADRVIVDGYTAPQSNTSHQGDTPRFSLGVIGNINRKSDAEMARGSIGEGILIQAEYTQEGNMTNISYFLTNLSSCSVFVQSPACNLESQWHYATVVRVPKDCRLKIFSDASFRNILETESSAARQGGVSVYDRTFNLSRLTAIRASFVKGWGRGYRRSTIMECPCWIELHLSKPQRILDSVLSEFTPGPGNSQT